MKEITNESNYYPELLKEIKNPPKLIYCEGNEKILNNKSVAIVGSRNMSEYGKNITRKIVKQLCLSGICIVSGLAVGIDTVAHQTCLENGGKTIAVLGSGLNKIFPQENIGLYKKIIDNQGCIISEYSPNTIAQKNFFPQRNRIVSGLSLGVLVIEAAYRSGTSITAKYAFEQDKKVFCVPNSIGSKNSTGTINLLKRGAKLITDGNEILYELGLISNKENFEELIEKNNADKIRMLEEENLSELDHFAKQIYFYIKENKVINLEVLANEFRENIQKINMYLTILELKGLIINKSGLNYSIRDEFYV